MSLGTNFDLLQSAAADPKREEIIQQLDELESAMDAAQQEGELEKTVLDLIPGLKGLIEMVKKIIGF